MGDIRNNLLAKFDIHLNGVDKPAEGWRHHENRVMIEFTGISNVGDTIRAEKKLNEKLSEVLPPDLLSSVEYTRALHGNFTVAMSPRTYETLTGLDPALLPSTKSAGRASAER